MDTALADDVYVVPVVPFEDTEPSVEESHKQFRQEVDKILANLLPHEKNIVWQLILMGFSLEEIRRGLTHRNFFQYCARILNVADDNQQAAVAIRKVIETISSSLVKRKDTTTIEPEKQPAIVIDIKAEDEETRTFLESIPEADRWVVKRLLDLGFTLEELRRGIKFNGFIKRAVVILNTFPIPIEQRIVAIRKLLYNIENTTDEEMEKANQSIPPRARQGKRQKRKNDSREPNNDTLKRLSILAALWDGAGVSLKELAELTGISERCLHDALHDLVKAGLVTRTKRGRAYYYFLTDTGVIFLERKLKPMFLRSQLPKPFGTGHCRNVRDRLLEILKQAKKITKELAAMGWWYRCIRDAFLRHRLEYIISWIERIKKKDDVENPGAYLWAVLMEEIPNEKRRKAIAKKVLAGLDKELVEVYLDEAGQGMTVRQAIKFALALRSFHRKCLKRSWMFTIGDVRGIGGWCRKKVPA